MFTAIAAVDKTRRLTAGQPPAGAGLGPRRLDDGGGCPRSPPPGDGRDAKA